MFLGAGAGNLTHGDQRHVWRVELYVVKRIDEVSSNCSLNRSVSRKSLCSTQVYVGVMRPSQTSELWGAVAEVRRHAGLGTWVDKVTVVGKPLVATHSRGADGCCSGNGRQGTAIGT